MNFNYSMINSMTSLVTNDSVTMIATAKSFLSPKECQQVFDYSEQVVSKEGTVGPKKEISLNRDSKIKIVRPSPDIMWLFERLELAITQMNNAYKYHLLGFYEGNLGC